MGSGTNDRDERFSIPLDPETALRGLLAVNMDDEPARGIWTVERVDSDDLEFLTSEGNWGVIATAHDFGSEDAASKAVCPDGTTGRPQLIYPAP